MLNSRVYIGLNELGIAVENFENIRINWRKCYICCRKTRKVKEAGVDIM